MIYVLQLVISFDAFVHLKPVHFKPVYITNLYSLYEGHDGADSEFVLEIQFRICFYVTHVMLLTFLRIILVELRHSLTVAY